MPTVVTGAAIEENADLAAVQVRVITAQEWEEQGTLTVRDGLEMMAGFRCSVHPATPDFAQSSLQGLPGAYIKVLVDGVEITGDIAGATPLEQIGLAGIERIEIVEGASSVLYGSDAMGGVIHLITSCTSKPHSWSSYICMGWPRPMKPLGILPCRGQKKRTKFFRGSVFSGSRDATKRAQYLWRSHRIIPHAAHTARVGPLWVRLERGTEKSRGLEPCTLSRSSLA